MANKTKTKQKHVSIFQSLVASYPFSIHVFVFSFSASCCSAASANAVKDVG